MNRFECEFESEVLAAAVQSRWPDRVSPELREHAAGCPLCADVAAIAGAIDNARADSRAQASLPDAGRVWWLAQLRARREAAEAAGRPITAVQVVAFGCVAVLLGACIGATSTWFQQALRELPGIAIRVATEHGVLLLMAAALLLVVPAAVYVAVSKD